MHRAPVDRVVALIVLGGMLLLCRPTQAMAIADSSSEAGRRMFFGEVTLQGRIAGHPELLPPYLIACSNCHAGDDGQGSANALAPPLTRSMLTQERRRRGGPPSMFSTSSFCRLLRTGVDPAYIVVTRRMPRYTLTDDQCSGLWRYLMEVSDVHANER